MAEPQNQRATLKDVIGYTPESYFTDDETALIKATFNQNPKLIKVLRKVFFPTLQDPDLPLESLNDDVFNAGRVWSQIPADEAKILAVARQDAMQFILGGLIKLKVMANQKDDDPVEAAFKRSKDSNR